ncbi:MAG: aspartate aminotransferase [Desulfobulbaceae bacterium A2]|nr:MAG: aspartate aminotransferase [Desulfobulbaceae bacterium A2]
MQPARRLEEIKPAILSLITHKMARLRAQGREVVNLGIGEPDCDTPDHIKLAAIKAILDGKTKYTPAEGTAALRQAIVAKFLRDNRLSYAANQILVSCGGKHSIANMMQAVLDPGDEVIIPAPYWPSFPEIVLLAGGRPVFVPCDSDSGYKLTARQLAAALTPRSKVLILNSPSNPTGAMYTAEELRALGQVLAPTDVCVLSDDVYEKIVFKGNTFCNLPMVLPQFEDRTVIVNAVSKTYAMTGWRIGYAAGPAHIIAAMATVQAQSTTCACSVSQAAAEAALSGDQHCITPMVRAFEKRRNFVVQALNTLPGVRCLSCEGAFYAFAEVSELLLRLADNGRLRSPSDVEFAEYLLEEGGISLVPGSAFGLAGHIRISFATSMATLRGAMTVVARLLKRDLRAAA